MSKSKKRPNSIMVLVVSVGTLLVASNQARQQPTLLPTASLAQEVRDLYGRIGSIDVSIRRAEATTVRDHVGQFIVQQVDAQPAISQRQIQEQLRAILCVYSACDDSPTAPAAFAVDAGPHTTRRQIVVAYSVYAGWLGPGGTITAIESYLWENGRTRRTSTGGSEFDGYAFNVGKVASHVDTDEYWVLTWGTSTAASGRGFRGQAALYRVGITAVTIDWRRTNTLNVTAQPNVLGWEVSYADRARLYGDQPKPYVLDLYRFDWANRTHEHVASVRYDRQ